MPIKVLPCTRGPPESEVQMPAPPVRGPVHKLVEWTSLANAFSQELKLMIGRFAATWSTLGYEAEFEVEVLPQPYKFAVPVGTTPDLGRLTGATAADQVKAVGV